MDRLGGLALASALETDVPAGNALVLAPGLLSGCPALPASRCTVGCRTENGKQFAFSSAGGLLARILASHGIAVLTLYGTSLDTEWKDLAVGPTGIRAVPSCCAGQDISGSLISLHAHYPTAAAFAVTGPAGEFGFPFASLAFGSPLSPARSRAGSGAGMILGSMRVKALVLERPGAEKKPSPFPCEHLTGFLKAERKDALSSGGKRCTGCTPGCPFSPKGHKEAGRPAFGKWPGYSDTWSRGDVEEDSMNMLRYTSFCDEFGMDSFALAMFLKELHRKNEYAAMSAGSLLDEIEKLYHAIGTSHLSALLKKAAVQTRGDKHDKRSFLLDSLGICSFASQAFLADGEAWSGFLDAAARDGIYQESPVPAP